MAKLIIVGAGLALLANAVFRYLESGTADSAFAADEERAQYDELRSDEMTPIQIQASETADAEIDTDTEFDARDNASSPVDEEHMNTEVTSEERPSEEIDELTESEVQDEPATPGEMTVDEDVTDELEDTDEE